MSIRFFLLDKVEKNGAKGFKQTLGFADGAPLHFAASLAASLATSFADRFSFCLGLCNGSFNRLFKQTFNERNLSDVVLAADLHDYHQSKKRAHSNFMTAVRLARVGKRRKHRQRWIAPGLFFAGN